MRKSKRPSVGNVYRFTPGELSQFQFMSVRQRLQWLEEANVFVKKALGYEKMALFDVRFKDFPLAQKKRVKK